MLENQTRSIPKNKKIFVDFFISGESNTNKI